MIILGLDPGTALVGWGVIDTGAEHRTENAQCVAYDCIVTDKSMSQSQRLLAIANNLEAILDRYHPQLVAIEKLFFSRNITTGMTVSEARGVLLYVIVRQGYEVVEYTPQEIKMSLTGFGRAEKAQMQRMVQMLLHLPHLPKPDDAADAIAVALTAAQQPKLKEMGTGVNYAQN